VFGYQIVGVAFGWGLWKGIYIIQIVGSSLDQEVKKYNFPSPVVPGGIRHLAIYLFFLKEEFPSD